MPLLPLSLLPLLRPLLIPASALLHHTSLHDGQPISCHKHTPLALAPPPPTHPPPLTCQQSQAAQTDLAGRAPLLPDDAIAAALDRQLRQSNVEQEVSVVGNSSSSSNSSSLAHM